MNPAPDTLEGEAGRKGSADNQFTHANLFGIYLTLVFCILTQPIGSLLMNMPSDAPKSLSARLGLFLLRFWRLNPIVCGAEGWLILVILGKRAVELSASKPLLRGDAPLGLRFERLLDQMHVVATSLLIIRAQQVDESGRQVVQQLTDLAYADRSAKKHEDDDESTLPLNRSNNASITRRPPDIWPTSTRPGIDEVLHPGVLARNDGWVDAVTVLSITTVTAKLAAVQLPWQLRVALASIILGWLGVALLVLLSHSRNFGSLDKRAVAHETEWLSKQFPWLTKPYSLFPYRPWLSESSWHHFALWPFVFPILVYLCYAIVFAFPILTTYLQTQEDGSVAEVEDLYGWAFTPAGILIFGWRLMVFVLLGMIIAVYLPGFLIIWLLPNILGSFFNDAVPDVCFGLYILSIIPQFIAYYCLIFYIIANYPVGCEIGMKAAAFIFMAVLKGWVLNYLYKEGSLFTFFYYINPFIVGLGVPAALELYSPEGSFKPGWLDWLG